MVWDKKVLKIYYLMSIIFFFIRKNFARTACFDNGSKNRRSKNQLQAELQREINIIFYKTYFSAKCLFMRENYFLKNNIALEFTIIEILCGAIVIAQSHFSLWRALEVYRNRNIENGNSINYTRTQYKSLNKNKIRNIASGGTLQFHPKLTNFHNKDNVILCFTSFDSLRNTEYVLKKDKSSYS